MADDYWIDPTPNFQKNAWSRVSGPSFFDSIVRDDGRVGGWTAIGADDYVIVPKVGEVAGHRSGGHRHRHSGYHSSPRYWAPPLYYTGIDFGDVAVTSTEDNEIPDAWEGNWKKRNPDEVGALKAGPDVLKPTGYLTPGKQLISKNKRVKLVFQTDGNVVLYGDSNPLWATNTVGSKATKFFNQGTDGNVVLYAGNRPVWNSGASGGPVDLVVQDDGNLVIYTGQGVARWASDTAGFRTHKESSLLGDIAGAIGDVVKFAGTPITAVATLVKDVPVLGTVLNAAVALDPGQQIGNISSAVGRGERLDKAILAEGRKSIQAVKDVAPYVQTALTFIPGVGTGIAAAIAAGTALAEGRSISDAVVDGLRNAVPGGALGKTAFNAALAIAHGESISNVALDAVKKTLPGAAQQAVDAVQAVASGKPITQAALNAIQKNLPAGAAQKVADAVRSASSGKNVREAVLQVVRASLPPEAQRALEVGIATAIGRNAQSAVAKAAATPNVIESFARKTTPRPLVALKPKAAEPAKGFDVAVGMLQHSAVTPTAMQAVRVALKPAQQQGFDQGVKAVRNHFTADTHSTLVRGGIVSRANWKPVGKNDKGSVPGRLVKDGKIVFGYYARA